MKKTDHSKKDVPALEKLLSEKRTALREMRFAAAGSRTRNVKEGKVARKEIARIMTALQVHAKSGT